MFKAAEKSPVIAHMVAQLPFFAVQSMVALDPSVKLTWDPLKGLVSTNSNLFNVAHYHFAQMNEVADAEAQSLKGYAEIIKAAGEFPRALVPPLQTWLKRKK